MMQMHRDVRCRSVRKAKKKRKISAFHVKVCIIEGGVKWRLETLLTSAPRHNLRSGGRLEGRARKVSCRGTGARVGSVRRFHAMRHVRVTSRGRSREHRVLPVTCPVTRSTLHLSSYHPFFSLIPHSPLRPAVGSPFPTRLLLTNIYACMYMCPRSPLSLSPSFSHTVD